MVTVKTCTACGESKPLGEYYPDKRCRDGKQAACKPCQRARIKQSLTKPEVRARLKAWKQQPGVKERDRAYRNTEHARALARARSKSEKGRASAKRYRATEKAKQTMRDGERRRRQAHPEKSSAHAKVSLALKRGRLAKRPCEQCGSPKSEAHHDDYSKPLEVRWLCRACHCEHHRREKLTG